MAKLEEEIFTKYWVSNEVQLKKKLRRLIKNFHSNIILIKILETMKQGINIKKSMMFMKFWATKINERSMIDAEKNA